MMDLCNSTHDDPIVHDRRDCPLCEALKTIEDLEYTNKKLDDTVDTLESTIVDLEAEIEELKGKEK